MNARPARSVLLSVAALAGLLEFSAPADAADSRQPGELNALANSLQRCLEQDSSLVQLDSTLMRDGRVEDSLRITRGPSQCRQPVDAPSQSCPAVSAGIHRAIQVDVASVDRHPAWSPNEHALCRMAWLPSPRSSTPLSTTRRIRHYFCEFAVNFPALPQFNASSMNG